MGDTALKLNEIMFYSLVSESNPIDSLGAIALNKHEQQAMETPIVGGMANSPIVKTQTGRTPQAALRQQQAFQFHHQQQQPLAYQQTAYPNQQFQQPQQTPVSRKCYIGYSVGVILIIFIR